MKRTITEKKSVFILTLLVSLLLFDGLVTSSSIMPYRVIYDFAFALLMAAFIYAINCIFLAKGDSFRSLTIDYAFPKVPFVISMLINLVVIISIIWVGVPNVGYLGPDILVQGTYSLLYISTFIVVLCNNAFVLLSRINHDKQFSLSELPLYVLGLLAIELSLSVYGFQIFGLLGVRAALIIFHILFMVLALFNSKSKFSSIQLTASKSELLLCFIPIGLFLLVFLPYGLYNLYSDTGVIVGNALSIINRGSLNPYFIADYYYTPLPGFISVIFSYTSGLDNLLLSINLPFLLGVLFLPFVVYYFLKSFVTSNGYIALIGALATALLDGLAVFLIPAYAGSLSYNSINWYVSSLTKSLYGSNIGAMWLNPYEIFAAVCAIASVAVLKRRSMSTLVLSGALIFMTFVNAKYLLLSVCLLLIVYGLKRISLKELLIPVCSFLMFSGVVLPVLLYKELRSISMIGPGVAGVLQQFNLALEYLSINFNPLLIVVPVAAFIVVMVLGKKLIYEKNQLADKLYDDAFSVKNFFKNRVSSYQLAVFAIIFLMAFLAYSISYVYFNSSFLFLKSSSIALGLNAVLLRYHILALFAIGSFFILRCNRRIGLFSFLAFIVFLFVGLEVNVLLSFPLIFVVLALPFFEWSSKNRHKLIAVTFVVFIFLGLFSGTFYSGTVKSNSSQEFDDLPDVLAVLQSFPSNQPVYSSSSYTYFVGRVARMANLQLSSNFNATLWVLDKGYPEKSTLNTSVVEEGFNVLFDGSKFLVLERRQPVLEVADTLNSNGLLDLHTYTLHSNDGSEYIGLWHI